MTSSSYRRYLLLLLALVLVSRLATLFFLQDQPQRFLEPDSSTYLQPARTLLETGNLAQSPDHPEIPETFRTPGYPLFLATLFFIFGDTPNAVVVAQIFLFMGTLVLTFRIGQLLFDARCGLFAGILLALDPPSFSHNFKILTETLSVFSILLFLLLAAQCFKNERTGLHHALAGALLGWATLVRPTTYYFFPVLLALLVLFYWNRRTGKRVLARAILSGTLGFAILVGGWQIRNYLETGHSEFSTAGGQVLLYTKGAYILAQKNGVGELQARKQLQEKFAQKYPESASWDRATLDRYQKKEAFQIYKEHPWLTVKTHVLRLGNFFLEPGTTSAFFRIFDPGFSIPPFDESSVKDYFAENRLFLVMVLYGLGFLLALYGLAGRGVWAGWREGALRENPWPHVLFAFFIAYIAFLTAFATGYSRSRLVVIPLICIYAGKGLCDFLKRRNEGLRKGVE